MFMINVPDTVLVMEENQEDLACHRECEMDKCPGGDSTLSEYTTWGSVLLPNLGVAVLCLGGRKGIIKENQGWLSKKSDV